MNELYAQALYIEAHKEGADAKALVSRLVTHLKTRGREKLLPGILRALSKLDAKKATLEPLVEVAHHRNAERALKEAAAHGIHATKTHVNHDLITGWRASAHGKLIDQSGKDALVSLYRKIITP